MKRSKFSEEQIVSPSAKPADLTLDKVILQEVLAKKPDSHAQTRAGADRHRSLLDRRAASVWAAEVNRKTRVHRIYREEGALMVRLTRRRKRASHLRVVPPQPRQLNERWSMDFVAATLLDGRRFRALTVVDNYSRHSQIIEPDFTLTGTKVVVGLSNESPSRGLSKDDHGGQRE